MCIIFTQAWFSDLWITEVSWQAKFTFKPCCVVETIQTLSGGGVTNRPQSRINIAIAFTCGTTTHLNFGMNEDHFRIDFEEKYLPMDFQSIHPYILHSFFLYIPQHNYYMSTVRQSR